MKFAKYTFLVAGIYGLIVLLPQYFLETRIGQDQPPPITHPEFFYGFIGVAVAFQLVFLIISRDPVKYRMMMLPSIVEKFSFASAVWILYFQSRAAGPMVAAASVDGLLGILFIVSYLKTKNGQITS